MNEANSVAYIDTSAILAVEFNQYGAQLAAGRINQTAVLISSGLTEAELRSAMAREGRNFNRSLVSGLNLIHPDRSLRPEFELILSTGYLRGADLWHVAVALFASPDPSQIAFVTLDARQREVARTIGFQT